jgi:hypothetical protein
MSARRVCETGTWLTSELRVDVATSGGSGFDKRTRVTLGVNLPPLEVIMSRHLRKHKSATRRCMMTSRYFWRKVRFLKAM